MLLFFSTNTGKVTHCLTCPKFGLLLDMSSGRGDLDHTTCSDPMTKTAVVALWAVCVKTEMTLTELIDWFVTYAVYVT